MPNYEEQGLASLFSKHGCSTGSEDGWTVVARKHKKHNHAGNNNSNNFTPLPVLSSDIDPVTEGFLNKSADKNQAHMGVSPSEATNNKYSTLSFWGSDDDDDNDKEID